MMLVCMPKAPKVETPAPPPTIEQARTDDAAIARQDERKRLRGAMNSRTTILGGRDEQGRKTLLGM